MTSIMLAVAGSAAGALVVVWKGGDDPRRLILPAIAIWGLAVVFMHWNPPRFRVPDRPYWRLEWMVPFWSYFFSRSLADLADVLGQVFFFMPLGTLLAARTNRQSFLGSLVIGFALGLAIEFGQAFIPSRTADISDAISAAAGTGLGLFLVRWGEYMHKLDGSDALSRRPPYRLGTMIARRKRPAGRIGRLCSRGILEFRIAWHANFWIVHA